MTTAIWIVAEVSISAILLVTMIRQHREIRSINRETAEHNRRIIAMLKADAAEFRDLTTSPNYRNPPP